MFIRSSTAVTLALIASQVCGQDKPLSVSHDGNWTATIVCEEFVSDKGALAKGYTVTVPLVISGGKIEGVRERREQASGELRYVGEVREGGELFIRAIGATGKPEYTPNRVSPGTGFGYTLLGQMGASSGSAVRQELRPCKATFARTR